MTLPRAKMSVLGFSHLLIDSPDSKVSLGGGVKQAWQGKKHRGTYTSLPSFLPPKVLCSIYL